MINLGDVNFGLGADTRRLQSSMNALRNFGRTVDAVANNTERAARKTEAAFRRQEKAATDALDKVLNFNQRMRKVEGTDKFIGRANNAFRTLNSHLTSGQLSALQYQRAMEQFKASMGRTQRGFREFSQGSQGAAGRVSRLNELMRGLGSTAVFVQGPLGGIATRISTLGSLMNTTGIAMAAFFAGVAAGGLSIVTFGRQLLDAGKQMDAFVSQFTAVSGSVIRASGRIDQAIKIARNTGQLIQAVAPGFARFQAAAEGTELAGQNLAEMFRIISAASTKLQLGADQTAGVFRALEQIISKGNVQAEELRGQLGDRLPGAFQIAARAMGVTTQKLNDMMRKGLVPATEFLPKFVAELARTFNIDNKPIDNYVASLNNMKTAWFQLRAELDEQIGVTDRVQSAYKLITRVLDTLRENLDTVKIYAFAAGGALLGLSAPAILSGIISATAAIGRMTAAMVLFNTAVLANPLGRLLAWTVRIVGAVAGATAAVVKFSDQIQVVNGEVGTLWDYGVNVWNDIKSASSGAWDTLKATWGGLTSFFNNILSTFNTDWDVSWESLKTVAAFAINSIVDQFTKAAQELSIVWSAVVNNMLADLQGALGALNSARKWLSPWLDDPVIKNGVASQPNQGFKWAEGFLEQGEIVRKTWAEIRSEIDAVWARPMDTTIGDRAVADVDAYIQGLRRRANAMAMQRAYGQYRSQAWRNIPTVTRGGGALGNGITPPGETGGSGLSDRESRALERKARSIDNINLAISRAREEVAALASTSGVFEVLNEQFKREDEVRRYALAMSKAGVDTETMSKKVRELYALLEQRDVWERARDALLEFRQPFESMFDGIGDSIIEATFKGESALKSLKDLALNSAQEILKSWWQLSITNPFKNALFGMNEPTLGGGFLGNLKKLIFPQSWGQSVGQVGMSGMGPNLGLERLGITVDSIIPSLHNLGGSTNVLGGAFNKFGTNLDLFGNGLHSIANSMQSSASGGGLFGWLGKLFGFGGGGGLGVNYFPPAPGGGLYAKGGAFVNGRPIRMNAKGNVYNTPQTFMTNGGSIGRMAEVNTEAIMPLARDSSGNLGVRSAGGGDGGKSVIELQLSPDLVAAILQQAESQSISISSTATKKFAESKEFELRAFSAVKKSSANRMK